MGRHFAKAMNLVAPKPYTDDFLAKVLERKASTFYRYRHGLRHPDLEIVHEIAAAVTPSPKELKLEPFRTYRWIIRQLLEAYYLDEKEFRLQKMAQRGVEQ